MASRNFLDELIQILVGTPEGMQGGQQVNLPDGSTHTIPQGDIGMVTPLGPGGVGGSLVPFRGGLTAARSGASGGIRSAVGGTSSRAPASVGRATVTGVVRNTASALGSGARATGRQARRALPRSRQAPSASGSGTFPRAGTVTNHAGTHLTKGEMIRRGLMGAGGAGATGVAISNLAGGDDSGKQQGFPRTMSRQDERNARRGQSGPRSPNRGGRSIEEVFPQGQGQPQDQSQIDPYGEFLQSQLSSLAGAYDSQINAIGGLGSLFQEQGSEAQENIGGFFDHARGVAEAGIPVNQEIFDDASGNVNRINDDLQSRLAAQPQQLTDIATAAGGLGSAGSVADRVSAATAPFMAAGETGRASALQNLTQHSSAGQSYLNQLASSTGPEAAMQQSSVEAAVNQQLQMVAYRQAELEGAKQRSMLELTSDIAGSTSERMAEQALQTALGLDDLPDNVNTMDFLKGQGLLQGLQPDPEDSIKQERDLIGLEQARRNLAEDINPNLQQDELLQSLSVPARNLTTELMNRADATLAEDISAGGYGASEKERAILMLQELDRMIEEDDPNEEVFHPDHLQISGQELQELRDTIRRGF